MTKEELIRCAEKAMQRAYAPYSCCFVGAALLAENGRVYLGCNLENAAFGSTICAERAAIASAVSDGQRRFSAIAVAGGKNGKIGAPFVPCGVCRQVLREFCEDDFPVYVACENRKILSYTLGALLPESFGGEHVK